MHMFILATAGLLADMLLPPSSFKTDAYIESGDSQSPEYNTKLHRECSVMHEAP